MSHPSPSAAPARRLPAYVAVLVVLVLAVVAGALAIMLLNRDEGSLGMGPSAAADPSTAPSAAPTPSASGEAPASLVETPTGPSPSTRPFARPNEVLPIHAVVRVTADHLRVREGPGVDQAVAGVVNAGDLLYITGSSNPVLPPIGRDGFDWYAVWFVPGYAGWPLEPTDRDGQVSGWVAATSGTESFVELLDPQCPGNVTDLVDVVAMTPYERVACLGDRTLTLEGTYGCPFCDSLAYPYTTEPTWLAGWPLNLDILVPSWAEYPPFPGSIVITTPPEVAPLDPEQRGSLLRVTGHFTDPRSTECSIIPEPVAGDEAPHPEAVEWYCRERFVVESWEAIGTDPAFEALIPG